MIAKLIAGNSHDPLILRASDYAESGEFIEISIEPPAGRRVVIHQVFMSLDDDPGAPVPVIFWNGDDDEVRFFDITKGGPIVFMTHYVCDPGNIFYLNVMADNETLNSTAVVLYSLEQG